MSTQSARALIILTSVTVFLAAACSSVPSEGPIQGPIESQNTVESLPDKLPEKAPEPEDSTQILEAISEHLALHDFDAALMAFDLLDEKDTVPIVLLKASILSSAGRGEEAAILLEELSEQDPTNVEILYVLAETQRSLGKEREYKALLEQVIKLSPTHAPALADLGNIALRSKIYRTAEAYFDKSLSQDPQQAEALIGKARIQRLARDPRGAEKLLNRAISAYPTWSLPLAERARIYREEGFLKHALSDLDRAVAMDSTDYWLAVDRGNILMDLGRNDEALGEFERAIELDSGQFLAYVYSAGLKDVAGDFKGAERDYASLARLKPEYYFAQEALGILRMRDSRWREARDAFIEAYTQAPNHTNYALLAALNWMKAGKPGDAKPFLAKILPTVPRESTEWYILRLYHDMTGDTDIAVRIDREANEDTRARMLYYLAQYYEIKGISTLADRYHLQVQDLNRRNILEWRLNEWALQERGLKG